MRVLTRSSAYCWRGSYGYNWPFGVALLLALFSLVAVLLPTSAQAHPHINYDQPYWDENPVDIVQGGVYDRETLAELIARPPFSDYGISRDFAYYSDVETMYADDTREWAGWRNGQIAFSRIRDVWIQPSFDFHRYFSAYVYGNSFIARPCANFSRNFENPQPPSISGTKWNDLNGNGRRDAGEPPIPGWTIYLYKNGVRLAQKSTDGQGSYRFTISAAVDPRLTPGQYEVREEARTGWAATGSVSRFVNVVGGSSGAGRQYAGNDFFNRRPAAISGHKYEDYNADGDWDLGEPALEGWRISLSQNGQTLATTLTDENGSYRFEGLAPGTYTVSEESRAGYEPINPIGPLQVVIPPTHLIEYANNDFGNFHPYSISGHKYEDMEQDGNYDPSADERLEGWTIRLFKVEVGRETEIASDVTDSDGAYRFVGLRPGTYRLKEDLTPPWEATETPEQIVIPAGHGFDLPGNDFGNFYPGQIAGVKWDDANVDGVRQPEERLLSGWTVALVKDGSVVATTNTGEDGSYRFSRLDFGSYEVWEALGAQDNWRQTYPSPGIATPPFDTTALGHHSGLLITSHSVVDRNDFGNVKLGSVLKTVRDSWWKEALPGVAVTLSEVEVPGTLENAPALPQAKSTDAEGEAGFERLLPGSYLVQVAVPEGWEPHPADGYQEELVVGEGQTASATNELVGGHGAEPRTLGLWKHWRKRYSYEEMVRLIERVQTGSEDFVGLTPEGVDSILDVSGTKGGDPFIMAQAQYLVLWLNLASERLGFLTTVDLSKVPDWEQVVSDVDGTLTMHELMLQLRAAFNGGTLTPEQWEALKDVCDWTNNSRTVQ